MKARARWIVAGVFVVLALTVPMVRVVESLRTTHRAVATYTALLAAVNAQDIAGLRTLCTARYLESHPPELAPGGGLVGLPRAIHRNFQVWREGDEVWLCPTDRVGPVYRFVFEAGVCRFDGLVGLLRPGGRVGRSGESF